MAADSPHDLGTVLAGEKDLSTYYNLIREYPDILFQLPNYAGVTVIVPTNDAFEKLQNWDPKNKTLVTNMLEYHILQGTVSTKALPEGPSTFAATLLTDRAYTNVTRGQNVIINKQPGDVVVFTSGSGSRSTLLTGDINFTGGLIQVVDTLLVPPPRLEATARDGYGGELTAFLGALYAADLLPLFEDSENVTIFAPRNAAFQLVAGALAKLDGDELKRVLRYHLVPGRVVPSQELFAPDGPNSTDTAATEAGTDGSVPLRITRAGNNLYVNAARVIQPDILVANGVVHMVDAVLNPAVESGPGAVPDPAQATQAPAFGLTGATSTGVRAPTPFTTALPCTSDCPVPTTAEGGGEGSSTTTSHLRTTRSEGDGVAGPRCTGLAGVGIGLVGVGMQMGMFGVV